METMREGIQQQPELFSRVFCVLTARIEKLLELHIHKRFQKCFDCLQQFCFVFFQLSPLWPWLRYMYDTWADLQSETVRESFQQLEKLFWRAVSSMSIEKRVKSHAVYKFDPSLD